MKIGRSLSRHNLGGFDFDETKKNVFNYFLSIERLQWEWAKLNAQKGVSVDHDLSVEYRKQPYSPIDKDNFGLSARDCLEGEIEKYISTYYWARDVLTEKEQVYIHECFINHKYEDEIVNLLGLTNSDSNEFRTLKKSAVFKFADFLNLVVYKD